MSSISTALTHADVRKIMRLVEALHRSRLSSLRIEADGLQIDIGKDGVTLSGGLAAPAAEQPAATQTVTIFSPQVGRYSAGNSVAGSAVKTASVLGLIETLDEITAITANVTGTIAEQLVRDGDFVEYGQALYRIIKTTA